MTRKTHFLTYATLVLGFSVFRIGCTPGPSSDDAQDPGSAGSEADPGTEDDDDDASPGKGGSPSKDDEEENPRDPPPKGSAGQGGQGGEPQTESGGAEGGGDRILVEVQVSSDRIIDFEFDWGRDGIHCSECNDGDGNDRLVFSDREYNVWLGYVNPKTGAFEPEDGRAVLIDTRGAFATDFGNGPEWMFGKDGSQIVYTKYLPGQKENTLSASVAVARFSDGEWDAGIVPGGLKKQSPAATLDIDDPAPRMNYQDFAKKKLFWRTAGDPDSERPLPIDGQTGGGSRRWIPGTRRVIFSGGAEPDGDGKVYQQVFVYDTDTDTLEQLTFDPVTKWGAFMWRAPEFDDEFVFFTMYGRSKLALYRMIPDEKGTDQWTLFNLIEMPERLPYIWSPEPFVYQGLSYVFFQLSSDPVASDMSIPTQIAMTGIDPDRPSLRLLTNDPKNKRVRMDPEHYITENGPYIYYNRYVPKTAERQVINDGVWRVDTELGPPRGSRESR